MPREGILPGYNSVWRDFFVRTWELIAEKAKALPPDKQAEVLDFLEFIQARSRKQAGPLVDPYGLLAGLDHDISESDIAEARREMWGGFPREIR